MKRLSWLRSLDVTRPRGGPSTKHVQPGYSTLEDCCSARPGNLLGFVGRDGNTEIDFRTPSVCCARCCEHCFTSCWTEVSSPRKLTLVGAHFWLTKASRMLMALDRIDPTGIWGTKAIKDLGPISQSAIRFVWWGVRIRFGCMAAL